MSEPATKKPSPEQLSCMHKVWDVMLAHDLTNLEVLEVLCSLLGTTMSQAPSVETRVVLVEMVTDELTRLARTSPIPVPPDLN